MRKPAGFCMVRGPNGPYYFKIVLVLNLVLNLIYISIIYRWKPWWKPAKSVLMKNRQKVLVFAYAGYGKCVLQKKEWPPFLPCFLRPPCFPKSPFPKAVSSSATSWYPWLTRLPNPQLTNSARSGLRERELRVANPACNPAPASYPSTSPVLSNL
jgi:hypothetical protein